MDATLISFSSLFYASKKPTHMSRAKFEQRLKRLTCALSAYDKSEGRIVHCSMKIRTSIDKIKSDLLTPTTAQLEIELSRTPMTMTNDQAFALF
jgi:hypothetical protein